MNSKNHILEKIRNNISERYEMPDLNIQGIQYTDKIFQFIEINKAVGGNAILLEPEKTIDDILKLYYPDAKNIASNIPEIKTANINPDNVDDPHQLDKIDVAIVEGQIGVSENGAVWIPQNVGQKVIYFIAEYLVIILNKKNIVNNMHEAYQQTSPCEKGFGLFISGPSKTADIEQALVVGAHGAKGVLVVLK